MSDSRPYHHGDLRAALVRTALEALEAEGPEALTIRGLAAKAGVSKAAPYRHFAHREDLLAALVTVALVDLADGLEVVVARGPSPTLLADLGRTYLALARSRPRLFQLTFSNLSLGLASEECLRAGDRALAALEAGVRKVWSVEPAGGWRAMVVAQWASIHGLCTLVLEGLIETDEALEAALFATFGRP